MMNQAFTTVINSLKFAVLFIVTQSSCFAVQISEEVASVPGTTDLVSVNSTNTGNGNNARFVGFKSYDVFVTDLGDPVVFFDANSTDLTRTAEQTQEVRAYQQNVFHIYYRTNGQTFLATPDISDGKILGNWFGSWIPRVSANGEYLVFQSNADNFVDDCSINDMDCQFDGDPQIENKGFDTYLVAVLQSSDNPRKITLGKPKRISLDVTGATIIRESFGDGWADVSNQGWVAYSSDQTNLIPGGVSNNHYDVFLYRGGGVVAGNAIVDTVLISKNVTGGASPEEIVGSQKPSISDDGQYVVFQSDDPNLILNDNNNSTDVFLYSVSNNTVTRIAEGGSAASISGDGRYVTYAGGGSTNLITNGSFESHCALPSDSYVLVPSGDSCIRGWLITGHSVDVMTRLWPASDGNASVNLNGDQPGSIQQTINTLPGVTYYVRYDIARDPTGSASVDVTLSAGNQSVNVNYVNPNTTFENMFWEKGYWQFVANSATTTLSFQSLSDGGPFGPVIDNVIVSESPLSVQPPYVYQYDVSEGKNILIASGYDPSANEDGRLVAFSSVVSLLPNDTNNAVDTYVYDRVSGKLDRISITSEGGDGLITRVGASGGPSISSDGKFVVFGTDTALSPLDTQLDPTGDVYIHSSFHIEDTYPRIVVTPDRASVGNYGWVLFEDSSKQWVDAACRSHLEAIGIKVDVKPWSEISTYPDNQYMNCSEIAGVNRQFPRMITTPDKESLPNYGWVLYDGGLKHWIDSDCRSQLISEGLETDVLPWEDISKYADRDAVPCEDIVSSSDGYSFIVTTPDRESPGNYGWVVFPNNTKQWIDGFCRDQLVSNGAEVSIAEWNDISLYSDVTIAQNCEDLR